MAKVFYDQDVNWEVLKRKKVAIIGYGSQGHAHALNLKESGVDVVVGLYKGSHSAEAARKAGLSVKTVSEAVAEADAPWSSSLMKNRPMSIRTKSVRTSKRQRPCLCPWIQYPFQTNCAPC